jgi:hypothetical protein
MTHAPALINDSPINNSLNDSLINKSGSANHLKNIFDQSLAILCEGASSVRVRRRSLPLHIDPLSLQKRALSDAANALTALWNISASHKKSLQRILSRR